MKWILLPGEYREKGINSFTLRDRWIMYEVNGEKMRKCIAGERVLVLLLRIVMIGIVQ